MFKNIRVNKYPLHFFGWVLLFFAVLFLLMACSINLQPKNNDKDKGNSDDKPNNNNNNVDIEKGRGKSFSIKIPADLELIRNNPAGAFYLENDIDMTGISFIPIATFSGKLYGQTHKISNISINITENHAYNRIGFIQAANGAHFEKLAIDISIRVDVDNVLNHYKSMGGFVSQDNNGTYSEIYIRLDINADENVPLGGLIGTTERNSRTIIKNTRVEMSSSASLSSSRAGFIGTAPNSSNIVIENSYVYDIDGGLVDTGLLSFRGAFIGFDSGTNLPTIKNSFWLERTITGFPGETIRNYAMGSEATPGNGYRAEGTTVRGFLLDATIDFSVEPFASLDTAIWTVDTTGGNLPKLKWE